MSKLSPLQVALSIGGGLTALLAGALISSSVKSSTGQTIALATFLTVPAAFGVHLVLDSHATKRINQAERRASLAESEAVKSNQDTREALEALTRTRLSLIEAESALTQLQGELERMEQILRDSESARVSLQSLVSQLTPDVSRLESALAERNERVEELEAEVEEWERTFHGRLEAEADKRFKVARANEIQKIFDEHDAINSQLVALFKRLKAWAVKVADGHESKRGVIMGMAQAYNQNLEELSASVSEQTRAYLTQIELLQEKVALLQQQLAGDLVHLEKLECGFDQNGHIANAIAEWLWNHRKIPLKVTGFEESAGIITAGYAYSRSTTPEALSKVIQDNSPAITRSLGLYAIETPQKLKIADVLTLKVRRERPQRKTDKGSLYRSKEDFINYILSQPLRLRIIGEPGSGKTPTVAILLSHILNRGFLSGNTPNGQKLSYCIVESCNPLAGISVKNGDVLDFCLKWNSGAKGFKGLADEYKFRKNPANGDYKNQVGYIWVADEIDNTMAAITKDEAKPFKDAIKDGGHVNIGIIVMGQSAMVSTSKGLSIDDQKMMTNIYIDPVSIRTFLTQYGERFYAKKAVERALNTLEELELEIEEQNELICDTAREFRIAMVTANRSPVFYQLPYFDSANIEVDEYLKMLNEVTEIREGRGELVASLAIAGNADTAKDVPMSGRSPYMGLGTGTDRSVKPNCPHCGSDNTRSKGDKWLCQNPDHSKLAPNKPKSWKK